MSKNNDSLPFNLRKGWVTSNDVAKLSDKGDAKSEVLEANTVSKCKNSLKRLPSEIYEEYIVSLDLKRYKNGPPRFPYDEFVNIVADFEGGNMRDDDVMLLDPEVFAEVRQPNRNKESFCRMLKWLTDVAKDPCHPSVISLPEISEWKSRSDEVLWKHVLLAREAISLKRHEDMVTEPPNWQVYEVAKVISVPLSDFCI